MLDIVSLLMMIIGACRTYLFGLDGLLLEEARESADIHRDVHWLGEHMTHEYLVQHHCQLYEHIYIGSNT